MNKPSSLIWMVFILLVILPTPAGKFIIDLAGGIFLINYNNTINLRRNWMVYLEKNPIKSTNL